MSTPKTRSSRSIERFLFKRRGKWHWTVGEDEGGPFRYKMEAILYLANHLMMVQTDHDCIETSEYLAFTAGYLTAAMHRKKHRRWLSEAASIFYAQYTQMDSMDAYLEEITAEKMGSALTPGTKII